jgi:hypothetical protein
VLANVAYLQLTLCDVHRDDAGSRNGVQDAQRDDAALVGAPQLYQRPESRGRRALLCLQVAYLFDPGLQLPQRLAVVVPLRGWHAAPLTGKSGWGYGLADTARVQEQQHTDYVM